LFKIAKLNYLIAKCIFFIYAIFALLFPRNFHFCIAIFKSIKRVLF